MNIVQLSIKSIERKITGNFLKFSRIITTKKCPKEKYMYKLYLFEKTFTVLIFFFR